MLSAYHAVAILPLFVIITTRYHCEWEEYQFDKEGLWLNVKDPSVTWDTSLLLWEGCVLMLMDIQWKSTEPVVL